MGVGDEVRAQPASIAITEGRNTENRPVFIALHRYLFPWTRIGKNTG